MFRSKIFYISMGISLQCAPLIFIDASMDSSNDVVPIRQQAITRTNSDQIRSGHVASLCCLSGTHERIFKTKAELSWMRIPKQIEISLKLKCNWFYSSTIYGSGIFNAAAILSMHNWVKICCRVPLKCLILKTHSKFRILRMEKLEAMRPLLLDK